MVVRGAPNFATFIYLNLNSNINKSVQNELNCTKLVYQLNLKLRFPTEFQIIILTTKSFWLASVTLMG